MNTDGENEGRERMDAGEMKMAGGMTLERIDMEMIERGEIQEMNGGEMMKGSTVAEEMIEEGKKTGGRM